MNVCQELPKAVVAPVTPLKRKNTMNMRRLGHTNLMTFPLIFGGNVLGWTLDTPSSFAVLDAFVGAGGNMVDTADVYSRWVEGNQGGESETILGQWMKLRGNRAQLLIATKVGMDMGEGGKGLSPSHIERSIDASLKRLQTDYIDLYQSHLTDPLVAPEETMACYGRLIEKGKVRCIGASNHDVSALNAALRLSQQMGIPSYATLQPHYNLCEREIFEPKLAPYCIQHGLGVIPFYALASGFLTGKYRSAEAAMQSTRSRTNSKYANPKGWGILSALDAVAQAHDTKPATVALAWLLAQAAVTAPIVSATSQQQVQELVQAVDLILTPEDLAQLNLASSY
jgi:aryl-alcohol dehydrogenase-like predicted oxidoreductase